MSGNMQEMRDALHLVERELGMLTPDLDVYRIVANRTKPDGVEVEVNAINLNNDKKLCIRFVYIDGELEWSSQDYWD